MLGELTREHASHGHLYVPGRQHFREAIRFVLISVTVLYFPESFVRRFSLFFTLCLKRRQVDAGPDTIPLIPRKFSDSYHRHCLATVFLGVVSSCA